MRGWHRRWAGAVLLPLLLAAGCIPEGLLPALATNPPGGPGAPVGNGPPPGPPPGPLNLGAPNDLARMQAADLAQKLSGVQDECKVLLARQQQMEHLVEEKERALILARTEIQSATEEVSRTRLEMSRWRQEVANLRERLRAAEKENVATLEALVKLLEKMNERDKPPPRPTPLKESEPTPPTAPP